MRNVRRVQMLLGCCVMALLGTLASGADRSDAETLDLTKLPAAATTQVDFARDIQPILVESCISCHGPKKHEGGLRLSTKDATLAGGDNGPVIVPGKSAESRLIHLVGGVDPDAIMPPAKKAKPLSAAQVGLLRAWIDQGAKWPDGTDIGGGPAGSDHWSYKKPVRPELPAVTNAAWPRNPIDRLVLARLEKEGLTPSPEADRATLIRRVSLDLTGLPPTPEEVEAFEKDQSAGAYEKVVDRLLASPHYGERWGRVWLDLARYADTHGYERDHLRNMWPWRDWVIDAFNRDTPFDQFTIEQIAGDLLPDATTDQKLATGFHRNAMLNSEDGSDDEEWRVAAIVDRVNTTGTVWLGSTIACAQCHTHKYDPIRQKEYYQLFAYFNNTADGGNANKFAGPEMEVPRRLFADETTRAEIARLEAELVGPNEKADAAQVEWEEKSQPKVKWTVLDDLEFTAGGGGKATKQPDGSWLVKSEPVGVDTYTLKAKTDLTNVTGIRLEVLPDESLPGEGPGRSTNGNFVLNEIKLTAAPREGDGKAKPVTLQNPRADFSQEGRPVAQTLDGNVKTGWGVVPQTGKPHEATWETKGDLDLKGGAALVFTLEQRQGEEQMIGRFRISVTSDDRSKFGDVLPPEIQKILTTAAAERSDEQKATLRKYYRGFAPELQPIRDRLAQLQPGPKVGKSLVMKELPKPRETYVMLRGNFQSRGETVAPGVPEVLNPLPTDAPPNRVGLAKWLVARENPLTARVAVNRMWEQYWGTGIVKTSEDFGIKGDPPTHPDLLDWLATEFMERGWSQKQMHRLVVTSATYRQSSRVTPALLEKDPENRLFARGPRVRLEAEMVRDQALAAGGLLSRKVGGPSVMPPQPEGVWNRPYSGSKWETSKGEDRYRRAVYTFWRRTVPYPSMTTFDAPSRENCTVRRPRTNTPLQALTALNDPVYVEAAQALARRVLASEAKTPEDRAAYAFRLCTARQPEPAERERLVALYQQELDYYKQNRDAAKTFVTKGSPAPPPDGADVSELAAWSVVGNVLLNLDETITKP